MNAVELTKFLIGNIVKEPDMVSVKQFEDDENCIIEVLVDKDDISSIIGKDGIIINSIRNIVNLAAYNQNKSSIKINIDSF